MHDYHDPNYRAGFDAGRGSGTGTTVSHDPFSPEYRSGFTQGQGIARSDAAISGDLAVVRWLTTMGLLILLPLGILAVVLHLLAYALVVSLPVIAIAGPPLAVAGFLLLMGKYGFLFHERWLLPLLLVIPAVRVAEPALAAAELPRQWLLAVGVLPAVLGIWLAFKLQRWLSNRRPGRIGLYILYGLMALPIGYLSGAAVLGFQRGLDRVNQEVQAQRADPAAAAGAAHSEIAPAGSAAVDDSGDAAPRGATLAAATEFVPNHVMMGIYAVLAASIAMFSYRSYLLRQELAAARAAVCEGSQVQRVRVGDGW